eukprot:Clim_evm103s11 gene=Clim_evmTU103s11
MTDSGEVVLIAVVCVLFVLVVFLCLIGVRKLIKQNRELRDHRLRASNLRATIDQFDDHGLAPEVSYQDLLNEIKDMDELKALAVNFSELQVRRVLGRGTFGTVYEGALRGTRVAIKRLSAMVNDPKVLISFLDEVLTLQAIRHPNIVLFMGATFDPQNLCIITELCELGNLHDLLAREMSISRKREKEARRLAGAISAHARRIQPGGARSTEDLLEAAGSHRNESPMGLPPPLMGKRMTDPDPLGIHRRDLESAASSPLAIADHEEEVFHDDFEYSQCLLTEVQRLDIALDVLTGLCFLHENDPPICHGDLKSPNILIDSSLRAKISDLGLATRLPNMVGNPANTANVQSASTGDAGDVAVNGDGVDFDTHSALSPGSISGVPKTNPRLDALRIPSSGSRCGGRKSSSVGSSAGAEHAQEQSTMSGLSQITSVSTAQAIRSGKNVASMFWAAPELLKGSPPSSESDMYAFAIVLWEVMSGHELYEGKHPLTVAYNVAKRSLRPALPKFKHLATTTAPDHLTVPMERRGSTSPDSGNASTELKTASPRDLEEGEYGDSHGHDRIHDHDHDRDHNKWASSEDEDDNEDDEEFAWCSPALKGIIERAWCQNPFDRLTAEEAKRQLLAYTLSATIPDPTMPSPSPQPVPVGSEALSVPSSKRPPRRSPLAKPLHEGQPHPLQPHAPSSLAGRSSLGVGQHQQFVLNGHDDINSEASDVGSPHVPIISTASDIQGAGQEHGGDTPLSSTPPQKQQHQHHRHSKRTSPFRRSANIRSGSVSRAQQRRDGSVVMVPIRQRSRHIDDPLNTDSDAVPRLGHMDSGHFPTTFPIPDHANPAHRDIKQRKLGRNFSFG